MLNDGLRDSVSSKALADPALTTTNPHTEQVCVSVTPSIWSPSPLGTPNESMCQLEASHLPRDNVRTSSRANRRFLLSSVHDLDLESKRIIDGKCQILLGTQISFGGLHRRVPQKQLYLLKVPSRLAA